MTIEGKHIDLLDLLRIAEVATRHWLSAEYNNQFARDTRAEYEAIAAALTEEMEE